MTFSSRISRHVRASLEAVNASSAADEHTSRLLLDNGDIGLLESNAVFVDEGARKFEMRR
jgi:hypothetical protein